MAKPNFSQRSYEAEIMDDFSISDDGLKRTLREIDIINHYLGGNGITLNALAKHPEKRPMSVVDLGCGSGEMLRRISRKWPGKFNLLLGIDANPAIIEYAIDHCSEFPEISFEVANVFETGFLKETVDVALCTLFLHHFREEEIISLLNNLYDKVNGGVVINDLERNWFAYYAISALTGLFSRSYMTKYDAKLSVLRGFKRTEWEEILSKTKWENYSIKWKWAFRWEVILWKKVES